jgi:hypothetical protein
MLPSIIAMNVFAGLAVAALFSTRAIVVAAPILLAGTALALWANNFDARAIVIWTCVCLAAAQAAFLALSFLSHKKSAKTSALPDKQSAERYP